jgi:polar amino acid transport system substrate-binding protein
MGDKRLVAAKMGQGLVCLVEQEIPPLRPGTVLVQVHNSLVSPGTELGGWKGFAAERAQGKRLSQPQPFGYSNAGCIVAVGENVKTLKLGDRVACIGGGYALHSNYAVVPQNLCVVLSDNVTYEQGAYGMLAATGVQAVRRGQPQLGEFVAVVGLGLVGQLSAQLYQLSGAFVIGWSRNRIYNDIARRWGIEEVVESGVDDEVVATRTFTKGRGLDGAVFAFGGNADEAYEKVKQCLMSSPDGHLMGRIVVVGGSSGSYRFEAANIDIRIAARTGPGYHDEAWELGADYPPAVVRWSTRANLALCMQLISEGKLNVDCLTTHTIPFENAESGLNHVVTQPEQALGVVFAMAHGGKA